MRRLTPWCQIHRVSCLVCLCCMLWIVSFILVGGKGKLISVGIGMTPPMVIAAVAATTAGTIGTNSMVPSLPWTLVGDWNLYRATLGLVMAPLVLKTIRVALEHAASNPDKVANQLGISTLPAIALTLLPVARYSRILTMLGWTPPHAIHSIHVSLGWYAVWAGALHVAYYTYVWLTHHEGSWRIFVLEYQCISDPDAVALPCNKCDCPRRMHYVTGLVVFVAFTAITSTSLPFMRRRFYDLFYRTHVIAAPVMILFLYMHWRKTSLYISGGVIVYVATWAPNYLEQLLRKRSSVRILAVDCIQCRGDNRKARNVIVLTIAASKHAVCLAGQYVKLLAPEFSHVSHPFTVVAGPEQDGTLRIMFRQVGKFTTALGEAFEQSVMECSSEAPEGTGSSFSCFPILRLDGFHGGVDRLRQMLHHDHVVLIAGGIGITSMLTMISRLVADGAGCHTSSSLTSVTLHWICRDPALVRYVKDQYFNVWAEMTSQVPVFCIIHRTDGAEFSYETDVSHSMIRYSVAGSDQIGHAFEPSLFSNQSLKLRSSVSLLNFSIIGVNTLVVYLLYYKVPSKDNVLKALYAPLFVAVWALILSLGIVLYVSPRSSYHEVPVSDYFGVGRMVKAKLSFNDEYPNENKDCTTWTEQTGRPSISEMIAWLDKADCPAVFLCGPSSLVANVKRHLQAHCCGRSRTNAAYVEHFEF